MSKQFLAAPFLDGSAQQSHLESDACFMLQSNCSDSVNLFQTHEKKEVGTRDGLRGRHTGGSVISGS